MNRLDNEARALLVAAAVTLLPLAFLGIGQAFRMLTGAAS